jgi:SAM-dependent methyltransferase
MRWYFKASVQKLLSMLPCGRTFNHFLQEHYGEIHKLKIEDRLEEIKQVFAAPIAERFGGLSNRQIVEIGTGWVPVLPITLALMGAQCRTFDVVRHLGKERTISTLAEVSKHIEVSGARERRRDSFEAVEVEEILEEVGAHYKAPVDTTRLPVKSNSQHATVSRLVLQHIPPQILPHVLKELYRILKPGGLSIHRVNLHDEYAQVDPRVTLVNFLAYPSWFWDNFGNNPIKYVNRARYPYYLDLFGDSGFRVLSLSKKLDKRSFDALSTMKIAKEFRHYSKEELATIGFTVILEKSPEE